jgi:hypothetical protein
MSKSITFSDAITRFTPIITTGIDVEVAIQEAVERIYEMGRYPGTTVEIQIEESDFIYDSTLNEWYYEYSETDYTGAIGFRNRYRGWSILDQTALYKDGINAGDFEFIDHGTIIKPDESVIRRYRCPIGWQPDQGPFYVLLKKQAPVLEGDDLIPIQSVGALKAAIQAVCYEYVADESRSQAKWSEFMQYISMSERQSSGLKKYYVGMDSSLRRKPKQFM